MVFISCKKEAALSGFELLTSVVRAILFTFHSYPSIFFLLFLLFFFNHLNGIVEISHFAIKTTRYRLQQNICNQYSLLCAVIKPLVFVILLVILKLRKSIYWRLQFLVILLVILKLRKLIYWRLQHFLWFKSAASFIFA